MDDRYRIRPATPRDVAPIAAIEREAFADPWSPAGLRAALDAIFLVADAAAPTGARSAVAGYVCAQVVGDEGEILNLAVRPADRRRGVARTLVEAALAELRRRGVGAVYLEVRESNAAARVLYRRLGFSEVGRRHGYYRRPREDALVLRAELSPIPGHA